jgi:hypothetical protein
VCFFCVAFISFTWKILTYLEAEDGIRSDKDTNENNIMIGRWRKAAASRGDGAESHDKSTGSMSCEFCLCSFFFF